MCQLASFWVTRDRVYYSHVTQAHSGIAAEHGLHIDGVRGPNAVKVEITPPDGRIDVGALDTWVYRVDQDVLPEWYDPADAEARVRTVLRDALIGLTTLDARYSKITDVSALVNLTTLYASYSKITDVSALVNLTTLDASGSQITDVSALVNLTTLYARWSKVKDIAALRKRGCTIY